jgi:hypothetical protein
MKSGPNWLKGDKIDWKGVWIEKMGSEMKNRGLNWKLGSEMKNRGLKLKIRVWNEK